MGRLVDGSMKVIFINCVCVCVCVCVLYICLEQHCLIEIYSLSDML